MMDSNEDLVSPFLFLSRSRFAAARTFGKNGGARDDEEA